ncbi:hypothetical protein X797_012078 [Metarhizium robertsii]|uniref:Nuf2 DHR10-like domain-containing protein n=1 Tax=Metarhizium robertsii TaxID=568076 RepID=A0A014P0V0_9HYPO|nr:hypothetical protein X797_012078 [Metarhizium robertsii]
MNARHVHLGLKQTHAVHSIIIVFRPEKSTHQRWRVLECFKCGFGRGRVDHRNAEAQLVPFSIEIRCAGPESAHAPDVSRLVYVVSTDVASSIKILDEIATGLAKEEEEMVRNAKERDALSERGNNAREVERAVTLRRQLNKWIDRTEKLCEQSNQKAQEAKAKMHELRAIRRKLTEEHTEKSKEMERLDILGAQMEKTSISCRGSTQRRKGEATQQG